MRSRAARTAALLATLFMLFAPTMSLKVQAYSRTPFSQRSTNSSATPATLVTVTTTDDTVDGVTGSLAKLNASPGADQQISLREAMLAANATPLSATLTIAFDIPTTDPRHTGGTWTIIPDPIRGSLPALTRGGVVIDGTTQAASPTAIILDGGDDPGVPDGLTIRSADNVVRGLTIQRFYYDGVVFSGPAANNTLAQSSVQNNGEHGILMIGALVQGNRVSGSTVRWNGSAGISITESANGNTIGGPSSLDRNYIFGNKYFAGVFIHGSSTHNNQVEGNWIGLDPSGQQAAPNAFAGIRISDGAHDNTIGARNVISGNDGGISIEDSTNNVVAGNIIGLAPDGATPLGNLKGGVFLLAGATNNRVGGTAASDRNIISGNGGQGVYIADPGSDNNRIQGNYIGVEASGVSIGQGNSRFGILIAVSARENLVGGEEPGAGNVIANNGMGGIRIDTAENTVAGNLIGIGADRTTWLGNQNNGVQAGGESNLIGPGNLIASNGFSGLMVSGFNTRVLSNTIEANQRSGICVIGARTMVAGNTIRGNGGTDGLSPDCAIQGGVVITGTGHTVISDNLILDNQGAGVTVRSGTGNRILANSISGNSVAGIRLEYGGNQEIAPPRIVEVSDRTVVGESCPGCLVEIFTDFGSEGRFVAGTTQAEPSGSFSYSLAPEEIGGPHVTATVTDGQGNTSAFAKPVPLPPLVNPHLQRVFLPQMTSR